MERELRCAGNKLYGIVVDEATTGTLEVRCTSRFCGKQEGVVVLHRFDLSNGKYVTKRYKELTRGYVNGSIVVSTALRTPGRQGSSDR